jgi:hypothetical protein
MEQVMERFVVCRLTLETRFRPKVTPFMHDSINLCSQATVPWFGERAWHSDLETLHRCFQQARTRVWVV